MLIKQNKNFHIQAKRRIEQNITAVNEGHYSPDDKETLLAIYRLQKAKCEVEIMSFNKKLKPRKLAVEKSTPNYTNHAK